MDESLLGKMIHALVFIGICAAIILIGWKEPLRYRFMSPREIVEWETGMEPATPAASEWMSTSGLRGTALDRAPYESKEGKVKYSKKFDSRKMGAPSETDRRANTIGKQ